MTNLEEAREQALKVLTKVVNDTLRAMNGKHPALVGRAVAEAEQGETEYIVRDSDNEESEGE